MPAPARVRVRYWAAARAAAGVAEETLAGDRLAEVLAAARAAHGEDLGRVLDRCSFLVDEVRARPETPLREGAVVEVLPPFAGGAPRALDPPAAGSPRAAAPFAPSAPLGWAAVALTVALAGAAGLGASISTVALTVALLVVQGVFLAGWATVTGVPAGRSGAALAAVAALTAGLRLATGAEEPGGANREVLGPVLWVLALAMLAAFLLQLARRDGRAGLVPSLTAAVAAMVVAVLGTLLLPARALTGGPSLVVAALAGAAAATVALTVPFPAGFPAARSIAGLALGAAAGVAAGAVVGSGFGAGSPVGPAAAAALGAVGAVAALPAARVVAALPPAMAGADSPVRSAAARAAAAAALPLLVAATPTYLLARILLG